MLAWLCPVFMPCLPMHEWFLCAHRPTAFPEGDLDGITCAP